MVIFNVYCSHVWFIPPTPSIFFVYISDTLIGESFHLFVSFAFGMVRNAYVRVEIITAFRNCILIASLINMSGAMVPNMRGRVSSSMGLCSLPIFVLVSVGLYGRAFFARNSYIEVGMLRA